MTDKKIPFIVTVEATEEGLWSERYPAAGNPTTNLHELGRFQRLCDHYQVLPTYLVTWPVTENAKAVAQLKTWQEEDRCEIGALCHPWCTPPIDGETTRSSQTFLCNLPIDLQYAKIEQLTQRIEQRFGRRPHVFRAGRYGFGTSTATCLMKLGYTVDTSVLPLFQYRREGGPDFRFSRDRPGWYQVKGSGQLFEMPITAGFTRSGYRLRRRLFTAVRRSPWKQLRLPGLLDRSGYAERVKLCPEGFQPSQLSALIRARLEDGCPALVLTVHSSSLKTGASVYSTSERAVDRVYDSLEKCFMHVRDLEAVKSLTVSDSANALLSRG